MATKTDDELDDMVPHIRYEVIKLIEFLAIGNGWVQQIEGLPAGWGTFAAESMLEAALIHTRCVAEFLRHSGEPEGHDHRSRLRAWLALAQGRRSQGRPRRDPRPGRPPRPDSALGAARRRGLQRDAALGLNGRGFERATITVDLAEGLGFEPRVTCATMVFETIRFGRSRIPPSRVIVGGERRRTP